MSLNPHSYSADQLAKDVALLRHVFEAWYSHADPDSATYNNAVALKRVLDEATRRDGPNHETYIARRGAFALAIAACQELIRDYEAHKDADGNVTGPDYNSHEIEALKTAIVRIQCIEAREPQSSATDRTEGRMGKLTAPTEQELIARGWNNVEARILHGWIANGMRLRDAEARLSQDLDDAAEEDGYDGP